MTLVFISLCGRVTPFEVSTRHGSIGGSSFPPRRALFIRQHKTCMRPERLPPCLYHSHVIKVKTSHLSREMYYLCIVQQQLCLGKIILLLHTINWVSLYDKLQIYLMGKKINAPLLLLNTVVRSDVLNWSCSNDWMRNNMKQAWKKWNKNWKIRCNISVNPSFQFFWDFREKMC